MVVLLQIVPEAKRRQVLQALDAYGAALRTKAPARRDQASPAAVAHDESCLAPLGRHSCRG